MVNLFRKILIRLGKMIPFLFAFIVTLSHIESLYATITVSTIIDADGNSLLALPISDFIGNIVFIDGFDVLITWILCVALELCIYSFRCAFYLTLNLAVRWGIEAILLDIDVLVFLYFTMALFGLYCVYGGFKMIPQQKTRF